MRKIATTIACLLVALAVAAKAPKWYRNVRNGICSITVYDKDGQPFDIGNGFFISSDGSGVTDYSLLKNAYSAITTDASGNTRRIETILGADDLYQVIRFKVTPDKKLTHLSLAQTKTDQDNPAYIIKFSTDKKTQPTVTAVHSVMDISNDRYYYTLVSVPDSNLTGCPVMNQDGTVIGIIQNGTDANKPLYVLDARYIADIKPNAATLTKQVYTNLKIKKALPFSSEQALSYIYLKQNSSDEEYSQLLNDYIEQFPQSADGYYNRGSFTVLYGDSTEHQHAFADLVKAINLSDRKDLFHYDVAKLIYNTITGNINVGVDNWDLELALAHIDSALIINRSAQYIELKGKILYAQKNLLEAFKVYAELNHTQMASAETYISTYLIMRNLNATTQECIDMLDTAINFNGRPYSQKVAPYILERASLKEQAERYRDAIADYYEYETLLGSYNMTSEFYFYREQLEIKAKMYEPALKDIEKACILNPTDSGLTLERTSLYMRLSMYNEALPILEELTATYADNSDSHRLLGICYIKKGEKEKACEQLYIAKQLGDSLVDDLIEQNCR